MSKRSSSNAKRFAGISWGPGGKGRRKKLSKKEIKRENKRIAKLKAMIKKFPHLKDKYKDL